MFFSSLLGFMYHSCYYFGITHKAVVVVVMIVWWLDLQLPVQSVPTTTKAVSSIPAHGGVYFIQHYAIKFISDLRQVGGFLWVLRFSPPIKLTATI
jgi:hypothetical protein